MLIRSLIVLLVVLNLGVAAWWLLHEAPARGPLLQPAGVPRLQLRAEATPVRAPAARTMATPQPPAETTACTGAEPAAGWRVYLPPQASAAEAETVASRIAGAGFSDFLVLHEGSEANGIALGRYGTREAAQRRTAALQAAGFAARCARIDGD